MVVVPGWRSGSLIYLLGRPYYAPSASSLSSVYATTYGRHRPLFVYTRGYKCRLWTYPRSSGDLFSSIPLRKGGSNWISSSIRLSSPSAAAYILCFRLRKITCHAGRSSTIHGEPKRYEVARSCTRQPASSLFVFMTHALSIGEQADRKQTRLSLRMPASKLVKGMTNTCKKQERQRRQTHERQ